MKQIINQTLKSKTLFEAADNLQALLNCADEVTPFLELRVRICDKLSPIYSYKLKYDIPFEIYKSTNAILSYVLSLWGYHQDYNENKKELENIISEIKNNTMVPQTKMISTTTVDSVMDYLSSEFTNFVPLLCGNPVKIMLLECEHKELAGIYSARPDDSGIMIRDKIFIFSSPKGGTSQVFAMLHEIGHLLSTRITMRHFGLPDSFEHIIAQLDLSEDRNRDYDREFFADLFAAATLIGSPFQFHNKLANIPDNILCYCKEYFAKLLEHSVNGRSKIIS